MNYKYYKVENNKKIVQLSVYLQTPEEFKFINGFSSVDTHYNLSEMEEITEEQYRNVVNILNIGQKYDNPEPCERV